MSDGVDIISDYPGNKFRLPVMPLKLWAGGLGCEINAADATARVALVGTSQNVICIVNEGTVPVHFRLGASDVVATTACKAIGAGLDMAFFLERGQTHLAAITRSGSAWLQITLGFGQ
jgi:hypothetical protein